MLRGKKILIGVSGSIAAYKIAHLIRLLVTEQAEVKIIMTQSATSFIAPLTLATLSKNEVSTDFVANENTGKWTNHVELGLWADIMIIAPATANTIAKMAHGQADNLLLTTYLSAKCPVYISPAMDLDMYKHPTTTANLLLLESYGNKIIPVESGELASGLIGEGRMAEPEHILQFILGKKKTIKNPFEGKKVLVSAGPTYEAIDPVRFIGNHSSGKMGVAIANAFAKAGAKVILVCGPLNINGTVIEPNINKVDIVSAEEMFASCNQYFENADIAIMAAAVADYSPVSASKTKLKKHSNHLILELQKTKDILKTLGEKKRENQILVGFALETNDAIANALKKLKSKNLDCIVLNSLQDKGAGFKTTTNKITILDKDNKQTDFELKSKALVAEDILNHIVTISK